MRREHREKELVQWFSTRGNVQDISRLSRLRCVWHSVGRGQEDVGNYSTQDSPHPNKNDLVPKANSAEMEKPWSSEKGMVNKY